MKIIKNIIKSILASLTGICQNTRSVIAVLLKSKIFDLPIRKVKAQKDADCLVLGNGPSLKETLKKHRRFIEGKKTVCVNEFAHSEFFNVIKPDYYVFADSAYWLPYASKRNKELLRKTDEAFRKVDWPMTIFLPIEAEGKSIFGTLDNQNISLQYFNMVPVRCPDSFKFKLYDNYLASPLIQNVLVAAIYIMLNIGYKKTYVVGADHSWTESIFVNDKNILCWKDSHFFDKKEVDPKPILMPPDEKRAFKMDEFLTALSKMFSGHQELKKYAEWKRAKILNASEASYVDAYERYKIK